MTCDCPACFTKADFLQKEFEGYLATTPQYSSVQEILEQLFSPKNAYEAYHGMKFIWTVAGKGRCYVVLEISFGLCLCPSKTNLCRSKTKSKSPQKECKTPRHPHIIVRDLVVDPL